jgi:hypothetical protein
MLEWPRCSGLASGARPGRSVAMHMCGGGRGCEAPREGGPRAGRAPPLADGSSLDEVKRLGGAPLPPLLRPQRAAGPQGIDRLPDRKLSSPGRPKEGALGSRTSHHFGAHVGPVEWSRAASELFRGQPLSPLLLGARELLLRLLPVLDLIVHHASLDADLTPRSEERCSSIPVATGRTLATRRTFLRSLSSSRDCGGVERPLLGHADFRSGLPQAIGADLACPKIVTPERRKAGPAV